ncbi:MAG TPA: gephyrin-like molybdotransferase Glp [Gemmatimonadales bacterium]|nr:gephyrin-like molybdotransferase Glp [Gemmatimonadales bacterium]
MTPRGAGSGERGEGRTGLSAREAALEILGAVRVQPPLRVPLDDALGGVLAEDVASPVDIPARTNSAMDGYACRSADVRGASRERPVRLRVVEEIPAGAVPRRAIGPGECARIFTGGPLPEGADGVVRQEDTDGQSDSRTVGQSDGPAARPSDRPTGGDWVAVLNDRDAGINFRLAGEDIRRGSVPLPAGTALGPAALGVLASLGVAHPVVVRRPRVGILASGDEIVDVDRADEIRAGTKTGSSNTHTLAALVRLAGAEPEHLGIARDDPDDLRSRLERAAEVDLLVTTAGISVGAHDHLRPVLAGMGLEERFWRLRMRPGAPVGFGILGGVPWIGLPGNPVSTMVCFELFVRPAIRRMSGQALPFRRGVTVRAAEPIALKPKLQHFLRAVVSEGPHGLEARLTGPQGSGILTSMVAANALLVVPEGQHETPAGAELTAIVLDDPRHVAEPPF